MENIKDTIEKKETDKSDKIENKSVGNNNGGKRPGSGRPKGSINKKTKDKKEAEDYFRKRVINSIEKIVTSQMNLARGTQYLFKIETKRYKTKSGEWKEEKKKPKLVKSQVEIASYLAGDYDDEEDVYYFITADKPDNKALDSLVDRVFGKATQKMEIQGEMTIAGFLNKLKEQDGDRTKPRTTENGEETPE